MKLRYKILILALALAICAGLLSGCKSETPKGPKPDSNDILLQHKNTANIRSNYEAAFTVTFYMAGNVKITAGQTLTLDRIKNSDKYYMSAALRSSNMSSNLLEMVSGVIRVFDSQSDISQSPVVQYVNGATIFTAIMGYSGGVYNAKASYHEQSAQVNLVNDFQYWVATSDEYVRTFMDDNGYSGDIKLKDFLMFSTLEDVLSSDMIESDSGKSEYDKKADTFSYIFKLKESALKDYFFGVIDEQLKSVSDEEYGAYEEFYNTYLPTIKSWLFFPKAEIQIYADKNNNITSLNSSFQVELNMNKSDITNILKQFLILENKIRLGSAFDPSKPLTKEDNDMLGLITLALMMFNDSSFQTSRVSVTFDVETRDNFRYDEESTSLAGVHQDIFLPLNEERGNRDIVKPGNERRS